MTGPAVQGIRWNPTLARYIQPNGRIVPQSVVRNALDASLTQAEARARLYADQLRAGELSLGEWERSMRGLVKDVHIFSVAGSVGGWGQLGPAEYGRIGQIVRAEYDFLYKFAGDIASGKQKLNGSLTTRAVLYVQAGRTSAEAQQAVSDADAGYDEEHNITNDRAKHCDECPALTALGWVELGALPLPGKRECRQNCKCKIVRRVSEAARRAMIEARARKARRTMQTTAAATAQRRRGAGP